jgi:hypothetical protein
MNYFTQEQADYVVNRATKKQQPVTCRSLTADGHVIMPLAFIMNSFYLPVDVLTSTDYKVESIKQCTGAEFRQFMESDEFDDWTVTTEGATKHMLFAAKQVGVSCRKVLETGKKVMIAKLWYGERK